MPWVDISQAAFSLGVSERTIRNWIKTGQLNARTTNGVREVEIPDPKDAPEGAHAFVDDESEGQSHDLHTQKRLEVALIECGRVKGTLASQERIMENLSANVAELNAKLQKSQGTIWRLVVACCCIAFVGFLAWVLRDATHQQRLSEMKSQFDGGIIKEKDKYQNEIKSVNEKHNEDIKGFVDKLEKQRLTAEARRQEEKSKLEERLRLEFQQTLKTVMEEKNKRLEKLESENKTLTTGLDETKSAKMKAEAMLQAIQKELATTEARLAESERQSALMKTRIQELEKTRRELEETEVELRRKLMGEGRRR